MKLLVCIIILSAMAFAVSAQVSDTPIEVIQQKWRFVLRNPALDEDPFRAINEQKQIETERIQTISENKIRAKNGQPQELPPVHMRTAAELVPLPASTIFIYELKIKNGGQKNIKNFSWVYVFFDNDGKTEIGRRQFLTNSNVRAGETKKITAKSTAPPSGIINAARAGNKPSDQYIEKVIIQRIEYSDGTVWNTPSK